MCAHQFFQILSDDTQFPDQWFLGSPRTEASVEIESGDFTEGVPYRGPAPNTLRIRHVGVEVQFSIGSDEMPVVSKSIGDIIRRVAPGAAEYFPVAIAGAQGDYEILNALQLVNCLDEARSEFTVWTKADNRPEMIGGYRMISIIRIDPVCASGHHLFRIAGWPLALLVSDSLKAAIEDVPNMGVVFDPIV